MTAPAQPIPGKRPVPVVRRPHGPRSLGILAAAVIIVAGSYAVSALRSDPAADAPITSRAPVEAPGQVAGIDVAGSPATSLDRIDRSIATWTKNLTANPSDFISATNLATLYHGRGRLSGDIGDQERALVAARTAISIAPTSGAARAIEATILYTLHDFTGALASAETLYRDDPTQVGALATMADAKLELGRLAEARADLESLRLRAAGPAVDVRFARLAYLSGEPAEALRLAIGARDAAMAAGGDEGTATSIGFYHAAVGEYARLSGDAATARAGFEAALAERRTDPGALIGLARIDAFEGRTVEAIEGLRQAVAIAPQPDSLALLGDLLVATGDPAGAADQYATVRLIATLSDSSGSVYDRQLILFELDHDGAAGDLLERAIAGAAARPDAAGHDLVAWANYRLGRLDDAKAASDLALASGIEDARILLHAGLIRIAVGERAAGETLVRRALEFGPALDPIEEREARS